MIIDILLLLILVLAIFKGYQRGLIIGVFSFVAIVIGIAAAMKLSTIAAIYIGNTVKVSQQWLPVISFIVVFIIVVLLVRLGANMIERAIETASFGWLNRLGGIALYAIIYIIVFSVLLFYAGEIKLIQPATIQKSISYSFIAPWGPVVINAIASVIPFFGDMFTDLQSFFDGVAHKIPQ